MGTPIVHTAAAVCTGGTYGTLAGTLRYPLGTERYQINALTGGRPSGPALLTAA